MVVFWVINFLVINFLVSEFCTSFLHVESNHLVNCFVRPVTSTLHWYGGGVSLETPGVPPGIPLKHLVYPLMWFIRQPVVCQCQAASRVSVSGSQSCVSVRQPVVCQCQEASRVSVSGSQSCVSVKVTPFWWPLFDEVCMHSEYDESSGHCVLFPHH